VRLALGVQTLRQRLGGLRIEAVAVLAHGEERLGGQGAEVGRGAVEVHLKGLVEPVEHGVGLVGRAVRHNFGQRLAELPNLPQEDVASDHSTGHRKQNEWTWSHTR
jgi:hypothetical protein